MNKILLNALAVFAALFASFSYANCTLVDRTVNLQAAYPFVIAPTTLNIKEAQGTCNSMQADTTHGLLKNSVAGLPLRCVPVEFADVSILFEDNDGNVIVDTLPNAIATAAACR
ncbi:TGF-beta family protein [Microbulbifer discodermiae]|uniref:TGF-beta family protein n=1 Tax=Microbulbifer sp. 2201CG32-9 TaxID=3232309 RepID=UPI00345B56B5